MCIVNAHISLSTFTTCFNDTYIAKSNANIVILLPYNHSFHGHIILSGPVMFWYSLRMNHLRLSPNSLSFCFWHLMVDYCVSSVVLRKSSWISLDTWPRGAAKSPRGNSVEGTLGYGDRNVWGVAPGSLRWGRQERSSEADIQSKGEELNGTKRGEGRVISKRGKHTYEAQRWEQWLFLEHQVKQGVFGNEASWLALIQRFLVW